MVGGGPGTHDGCASASIQHSSTLCPIKLNLDFQPFLFFILLDSSFFLFFLFLFSSFVVPLPPLSKDFQRFETVPLLIEIAGFEAASGDAGTIISRER